MRAMWTSLKYSSRSCLSISTALFFVLSLCLCGRDAQGQASIPAVVISQPVQLGTLPGNGAQSGGEPAGDTVAIDSKGDVIATNTYNNKVLEYSPAGVQTILGSISNPNGVAVDSQDNLYIGLSYTPDVVKIPLVSGTYAAISAPSGSTPACTGTDTAECLMSNVTLANGSGVVSIIFDAAGDMFFATTNQNQGGNNPDSIYECTAACLYSGSPAPVLLFQEPTASSPDTTGQLSIGGMAVDASGNLFFTDSAIGTTNNQESFYSDVNELVYTSGTGYASTPTVIYTYTPATPANYDAEIDGVAVAPDGTVYAVVQNTIGVLAFPQTSGTYSSSNVYLAATRSGKLMGSDLLGNLYVVDENGNVYAMEGANLTATGAVTGSSSSTTNVTTILNDGGCSSSPTVTFTSTGTNGNAFAATTGSCQSAGLSSASFATTITFTPTVGGINTATLTATDSSNNTATATVTGAATGTLGTPTFSPDSGTYTSIQTVAISDASGGVTIYYTTDGSTPTTSSTLYSGPITVAASETVSAIAVEAGNTDSAVGTAAYVLNIPAADPPTFSVPGGTYATPQLVALADDTMGATIYYTTDGSTPTTSSAVYSSPIHVTGTETISAIATATGAPASTVATATYTISLAPSAFQVIVMNQTVQLGSLPGNGAQSGGEPAGDTVAVDSMGDVFATNTYNNKVLEYSPAGVQTILGSISNPNGVAVDSQNNLYIGLSYTPDVVKIPYVSGAYVAISSPSGSTPACTGTDTTECLMSNITLASGSGVVSMVFDAAGDLFFATTNQNQGGNNPNSIYECTAACLYSGTPAPVLLFREPTASSPDTTGQLSMGGLAVDASGNVFFTDSAIGTTNNQESFYSNVNELVYTSGTGYASTPTVIYTYTPGTPGNYDAEIDGVAVAPNGTVYALLQNTTGVLAIPQTSGTYNSSNVYLAATRSGKLMSGDLLGNLYVVDENGNVYSISVDNLTLPTAQVSATPSTATNVTTILNDGDCSSGPTVSFAGSGTNGDAFTAVTSGSCQSQGANSASFATTVTFTPLDSGANVATLTATDSNNNTGTAEVTATALAPSAASTPTFDPAAGTYTSVQMVTISATSPGAVIYYTTDGSTPTTSSTLYSGPITVSASETINAIAVVTGLSNSEVGSAAYVINLPTATPTFDPGPGSYTSVQMVTISDTDDGAVIYYTTDGSTPTTSSTVYSGPIAVATSETINAIALAPSSTKSAVASASYAIQLPPAATPTFSVSAGTYTTVQTVSLSDATAGATIYYTTDGTAPTTSSAVYSSAITVSASETVNAIAVASGYSVSSIATAEYVINLPAPAFTLTSTGGGVITVPAGGSGTATITVTANATFGLQMGFSCAGFLPVGYTCTVNPGTATPALGGTVTTTVTVTAPKTVGALSTHTGPLLAGTMLGAALCLLGLRKRRRLQVALVCIVGLMGLSLFSGCGSNEKSTGPTSSQITVTATAPQPLPLAAIVQTIPFVVEIQ